MKILFIGGTNDGFQVDVEPAQSGLKHDLRRIVRLVKVDRGGWRPGIREFEPEEYIMEKIETPNFTFTFYVVAGMDWSEAIGRLLKYYRPAD
jgi:hypothetical protein